MVGAALEIDTLLITVTPSFDYVYADRSDIQVGQKIHAGVEVALPLLRIRAGLNQGYYTAGVGLELGLLSVDVATYGVELGEYPGQHEDRRYVAQVKIELGFDPGSFGFGGGSSKSGSGSSSGSGSGSGRRLKQRR